MNNALSSVIIIGCEKIVSHFVIFQYLAIIIT